MLKHQADNDLIFNDIACYVVMKYIMDKINPYTSKSIWCKRENEQSVTEFIYMAHKLYFPNAVCLIVIVLFCVTYRNGLTYMEKDWIEYIMYAMYPFDIWTMCYMCLVCMLNQSTAHSHACLVCNGMQASIHQCFSMLNIYLFKPSINIS